MAERSGIEAPVTEEQQNLSRRERRAQAKGKSPEGEGGEEIKDRNQRLRAEAAARRRKLRETERASAQREGLEAGERLDDAFSRSAAATGRFLRTNFVWLQWVIVLAVAGAVAFMIYNYRRQVNRDKAGALLASVLGDQYGRIASSDPVTPSDSRLVDPRPEFATEEAQNKAAVQAWERLRAKSSGALKLAAGLGQAGALYDSGKYAEARKAYEELAARPEISLEAQMKGRALEGVGLSLEAEEKYAEAKKAFEKLGNLDPSEFKKLQRFHVARIEYLLGNRDTAKEMLEKLDQELSVGAPAQGPTDYIGAAVRDLLKTVDPTRAAAEQQAISAEQMQEMLKQFQEMQKKQGAAPGAPEIPGLPPLPETPEAPPLDAASAPAPPSPKTEGPAPTAPTSPVSPKAAPQKAPTESAPVAPVTPPVAPAPIPQPAPTGAPE